MSSTKDLAATHTTIKIAIRAIPIFAIMGIFSEIIYCDFLAIFFKYVLGIFALAPRRGCSCRSGGAAAHAQEEAEALEVDLECVEVEVTRLGQGAWRHRCRAGRNVAA
jgi:hypothetical protein